VKNKGIRNKVLSGSTNFSFRGIYSGQQHARILGA
jgi:hypothetical protein